MNANIRFIGSSPLSFALNYLSQGTRRNGSARPRVQVKHLPSAKGLGRITERRRKYKAPFHATFMSISLAVRMKSSISLLEVRALSCWYRVVIVAGLVVTRHRVSIMALILCVCHTTTEIRFPGICRGTPQRCSGNSFRSYRSKY